MNILATHIFIQFDERWLPGSSPAQAPCAEELQMPEDLVDNGNLLKSHPCAMKLAVEMIHTLFFLLVHCDFKKILSRGNPEWFVALHMAKNNSCKLPLVSKSPEYK
jgi:hypothetical protein